MATASRHQISFGRFYLCKSFHAAWTMQFGQVGSSTLGKGSGSGVDLGTGFGNGRYKISLQCDKIKLLKLIYIID